MTSKCCFRCKHCYKNAGIIGKDMSDKNFNEIIKNFSGKTPHLVITGGEALMHPCINEILLEGSKLFKTHLLTNGYYLEKVPQEILSQLESIQISIYGYDNESYEKFTGIKEGAEKISQNIKKLFKINNLKTTFTIVATEYNHDILSKIIIFCENLGIKEVIIGKEFPLGRSTIENEETRKLINDSVKNVVSSNKTKVKIQATESLVEENYSGAEFHCQAGKTSVAISENGEVRPCLLINMSDQNRILEYYQKCVLVGQEMKYSAQLEKINDEMREKGNGLCDLGCSGFCKIKSI